MKRLHTSYARAFTLIEVLVVVAIIALLVSILIPALTRAKDQARRAVCSAHMHQMMIAVNSYSGDHKGLAPGRGFKSYTVAEVWHEAWGKGGNQKTLINLGLLYKKWIGGEEDIIYCPATYATIRDMPPTTGGETAGGWATRNDPAVYWTFGSFNYAVPSARGTCPTFTGSNPFRKENWSSGMLSWVTDVWVPAHPGLTVADFKVPTSPALAFDWYIGNAPPHMMGTGVNVLYADAHVRFHRVKATSSGQADQYQTWYELSIKQ